MVAYVKTKHTTTVLLTLHSELSLTYDKPEAAGGETTPRQCFTMIVIPLVLPRGKNRRRNKYLLSTHRLFFKT